MVLCIVALPLFAILGIFSVKYRKLTLDSLNCIWHTATLRRCESGLDERIRADMTGKLLNVAPKTAQFLYENYKLISWAVLILFMWSTYASAVGVYNYSQYGNCNGPQSTGFCLLDPTGANSKISELGIANPENITYPSLTDSDPIIGPKDAKLTIIEFGCYSCAYTKKAEPTVQEVIGYYNGSVNFQFKNMILPLHPLSYQDASAARCAQEQNRYIDYKAELFSQQENITQDSFLQMASSLNLNTTQFSSCISSDKYKDEIESDDKMGIAAGVQGTPTFFVNERVIVGPKPFKTFKTVIDSELAKIKVEQ